MLEVRVAKQSSAGFMCRCIRCHSIFKLFNYYTKKDAVYSEFECNCGRIIKIKEKTPHKQKSESTIRSCFAEEVKTR